MANPNLPSVFFEVPPESQQLIDANVGLRIAEAHREALWIENGERISSAEMNSFYRQDQTERYRHAQMVEAFQIGHTPDVCRSLAQCMLGKIAEDGELLLGHGPYATIERATYHGTTEINGSTQYWTTIIDAWWSDSGNRKRGRVLSYDEMRAMRQQTIDSKPHTTSPPRDLRVAAMDVYIDPSDYPVVVTKDRAYPKLLAQVHAMLDTIWANSKYRLPNGMKSLAGIAMTEARIIELEQFIGDLKPDDEVQNDSGFAKQS